MQDANSIEIFFPGKHSPLVLDIEDYPRYKESKWSTTSKGYWQRTSGDRIQLSRFIIGLTAGGKDRWDFLSVDHINHNKNDNRKCNLRKCTYMENNRHMRKTFKKTTSKFKGVYFRKDRCKWAAQYSYQDTNIRLGLFKTEIEAAMAYDKAVTKKFGEFALTNKQMGLY